MPSGNETFIRPGLSAMLPILSFPSLPRHFLPIISGLSWFNHTIPYDFLWLGQMHFFFRPGLPGCNLLSPTDWGRHSILSSPKIFFQFKTMLSERTN